MSKVTSVDIARQYKEWWNSRLKLTVYRKALMVCCILPLAFSSSFSLDLTQDYRPFSPSGVTDTNPYGLVDLDHFDPGDFTHCRWGVYQDQAEASHVKRELKFSHLTAEPFSYRNKDLFISSSIDYILRLALPIEAPSSTEAVWSEPDGENDGNVKYYLREETEYLFRKLHFKIKDTLIDKHTGQSLNDHSRKIIIIIHGWNASSSSNQFEGSLGILSSWVERVTEGSDWSVVDYHWEKDADTGNSKVDHLLHGYNTPEAAEIGHTHGQHLGELISTLCPYVKKVHFIAHSAGSWVARSATKHLLKFRDNASLQVTFLDPFIPNKINASSTL